MTARDALLSAREGARGAYETLSEKIRDLELGNRVKGLRIPDRVRDFRQTRLSSWESPGRDLGAMGLGLALGAGLVFFFGESGGRRRSQFAQKGASIGRSAAESLAGAGRDAKNRAFGAFAERRGRLRGGVQNDEKLEARVRSQIGHIVQNPRAIDVTAHEGTITLRGPVLRDEVGRLLAKLRRIKGVSDIENRLEVQEEQRRAQSRREQEESWLDALPQEWSPSMRIGAALSGGALIAYAFRSRDLLGGLLGVLGLGLVARSASNVSVRRSIGLTGEQSIDVHKTIDIDVPVEQVFRFWQNFENWPRFMEHLKEVRALEGNRSHWVASGPLGAPVQWDAEITEQRANSLIAWRTVPGSTIDNSGVVRFERNGNGTRVHVVMHYVPPAGQLGHAIASLFGDDPKSALDDDLLRAKQLLEGGQVRGEGGQFVHKAQALGQG